MNPFPLARQVCACTLAIAALGLTAALSQAGTITTFSGSDVGAGPTDPRPNSDAAAASFDAAASSLGSEQVITFESSPVGAFSNLQVAPGVSLTGISFNMQNQAILSAPFNTPAALYGYNTTSGGSNFVFLTGGSVTFTFATPTEAFGAYISGVSFDGDSMTFNDGTAESIPIPDPSQSLGGIDFVGFTDTTAVTSVTINGAFDLIGVDDVRYLSAAAVPEPAGLRLCAFSVLAALAWRVRARS